MIENPFVITEKIIPGYFCDREHESRELIKLLTNGNNVVLISQRRIGKTALIQFCYQQWPLNKKYTTVYVDILSTTNLQEFTYLLGREVFDVIKRAGEGMLKSFITIVKSLAAKIGFDPLTGLPSLNIQLGDIAHPDFTLKEIFTYLANAEKTCIIAIDEFQQIRNYPERNVEALIRAHLLQINNCRMVFSGSERHILSDMFSNAAQPFYQSAAFLELNIIPKNVYVAFIQNLFQQRRKRISEELATQIYEMFEGITFYIQRVCNGLFSNTEYDSKATEEILNYTLEGILSSYNVIYRERLSRLSIRQKELLIAIAKEKEVEKITSVEFINKYSLVSASAVQTALKSLVKTNLVVRNSDYYLVDDRFFRIWIERNY